MESARGRFIAQKKEAYFGVSKRSADGLGRAVAVVIGFAVVAGGVAPIAVGFTGEVVGITTELLAEGALVTAAVGGGGGGAVASLDAEGCGGATEAVIDGDGADPAAETGGPPLVPFVKKRSATPTVRSMSRRPATPAARRT